jgi:hypothetical protein
MTTYDLSDTATPAELRAMVLKHMNGLDSMSASAQTYINGYGEETVVITIVGFRPSPQQLKKMRDSQNRTAEERIQASEVLRQRIEEHAVREPIDYVAGDDPSPDYLAGDGDDAVGTCKVHSGLHIQVPACKKFRKAL